MHRPRGEAALSGQADPREGRQGPRPPGQEPLPQAWVPRVVNLALAVVLLLFLVPLFTHLGGLATSAQVLLVALAVPFVVLTLACLASATRPGSLGRIARRVRARRTGA